MLVFLKVKEGIQQTKCLKDYYPSSKSLNETPPEGCLNDHIVLIISEAAYISFDFLAGLD